MDEVDETDEEAAAEEEPEQVQTRVLRHIDLSTKEGEEELARIAKDGSWTKKN